MKRLMMLALVVLSLVAVSASCSRAHVESMTAMNEGVALAQSGRTVEAVQKLEAAAALEPTNHQVFFQMAIVHMMDHHYEAARDALNRAIAVDTNNASYQEKLGTVLMELSDWAAARTAFEKAIQLDAENFKAYYKLGRIHEELAQNDDGNDNLQAALRRYTEAIQHGPRFLESYSALGRLYGDLGYLEQSVQVLQAALQVALAGTDEAATIHALLGSVYQQQNKPDDAIREFRLALAIDQGMGSALFSLGWTFAQQGNRDEATRLLKKFVDSAGTTEHQDYVRAARNKLSELAETN